MIHYGPVRLGEWYGALCKLAPTNDKCVTQSTHLPWVDCPECLKLRGERAVTPAQVAQRHS